MDAMTASSQRTGSHPIAEPCHAHFLNNEPKQHSKVSHFKSTYHLCHLLHYLTYITLKNNKIEQMNYLIGYF